MMAHHNLERSLDDMIRNRREYSRDDRDNNGRHHAFSSSGDGPARRLPDRVHYRAAPYSASQMDIWRVSKRPVLAGDGAGGEEADETKLCISNLDSRVTNGDLEILFSELGELKDCSIHYDRGGRSLGTAEVVYMRQADAVAARNRYNHVKLDGKPMNIEFIGVNLMTSHVLSPVTICGVPDNTSVLLESPWRSRYGEERARASAGGRGPNYGRWKTRRTQEQKSNRVRRVTVGELDADLDNYWISSASGS